MNYNPKMIIFNFNEMQKTFRITKNKYSFRSVNIRIRYTLSLHNIKRQCLDLQKQFGSNG